MTEARTAGDLLRAARRRRRVSIERAAEETRIRADYLMRMESDEFDFLAPAYVRGFLRSYARFLGLDPEPFVRDFDGRFGSGRTDTGQIAALDRRVRSAPKQRNKGSRWSIAAWVAAVALLSLGIIGVLSSPEPSGRGTDRLAQLDESPSPEATRTESPSPTPTRSPKPKDNAIAFDDGIDVEIVASRADCWVTVTADGATVYTSSPSMAVGERAGPFHAEERMDIVLGNAYGVDLIVNGRKLGRLGGQGEVTTISLPADAKSLS
ncbi:MAG: helix-turn-helix domain-containing protein [Actinomycetota bacterium]